MNELTHVLDTMIKRGAPAWYIKQYFPGYVKDAEEEMPKAVLREPRPLDLRAGTVLATKAPKVERIRKRKVTFKGDRVGPAEYARMTIAASEYSTK